MEDPNTPVANRTFVIGSRASKLAVIQAEIVQDALKALHPTTSFTLSLMTTEGDKNQSQALYLMGGKALWTKELEVGLLDGSIDLIVHSLKDVPTSLPDGCELGAILEREDPNDCLVVKDGLEYKYLEDLPDGSVIGTSSVRRVAQLRRLFPKLKFADILDNPESEYTAIILAAAGLMRLGFESRITCRLAAPTLFHAVGQAALGVEIRNNDPVVKELVAGLTHTPTDLMCRAERTCLRILEGGCSVPVGMLSKISDPVDGTQDRTLTVTGTVTSLSGANHVECTVEGRVNSVPGAEALGEELARKLVESGAKSILEEIDKTKQEAALQK
ncbi:porphobilinogen deaminase [Tulasnella sp. 403]|nr:porphobilinogen deaminase [Tulasnella sp. 403]